MIRVLHILNGMNNGGIENFLMNIYRNIDRKKIQFDFLVQTKNECFFDREIARLGGKIFYVPPRNDGLLKNKRALNEFFKKHEYKIIHQHVSSLSYVEPLKIAKRYNIPVRIVHGHSTKEGGSFLHKYFHYINQFTLKSYATVFFACSDVVAEWIFGDKPVNYTIVKNGIDTKKYIFDNTIRTKKRHELGIKENTFVIGHVGRFVYTKNHEFIIDIFNKVNEKIPDSKLLLVGDGELRKSIEMKVDKLGLKKNVIFTGVRADVHELLQAMDCFVFPSHYEGFPVSLIEAQATGLPCVVSDKITKQIKLTSFIKFVDLEKTPLFWCNTIINLIHDSIRSDSINDIITKGLDINCVSEYMQDLYIKLFDNTKV